MSDQSRQRQWDSTGALPWRVKDHAVLRCSGRLGAYKVAFFTMPMKISLGEGNQERKWRNCEIFAGHHFAFTNKGLQIYPAAHVLSMHTLRTTRPQAWHRRLFLAQKAVCRSKWARGTGSLQCGQSSVAAALVVAASLSSVGLFQQYV